MLDKSKVDKIPGEFWGTRKPEGLHIKRGIHIKKLPYADA
jgi:hypothetical protein